MTWKSIYASYLKTAGELYVQKRFEELERLFTVMRGQIYDDEALAELEEFEKELTIKVQKQFEALEKNEAKEPNPLRRRAIAVEGEVSIWDWKLGELLNKHQRLAKKYSLTED